MGRKNELDEIASYLGNAAAHAAMLPHDKFAQREVSLYSSDASDLFMAKHWNNEELEYLRAKARTRATTEIRLRIPKYNADEKNLERFLEAANEFIDKFIAQGKG